MVKDKVNVVVLVADGDAALAGFKEEARAEFEQELLQVIQQGFLEFVLGVFRPFGQAGEFQDVRIADEVFDGLLRFLAAGAFDDGGLVF